MRPDSKYLRGWGQGVSLQLLQHTVLCGVKIATENALMDEHRLIKLYEDWQWAGFSPQIIVC